MSTVIICIILAMIVCAGIRSALKRAANGCCGSGDTQNRVKADKNISHYKYKYTMSIAGMHCNHCKQTVENALNSLGGVYANVDLGKGNAVIYSKEKCDEQKLKKAISSCGFTAKELVEYNEK